MDHDLGREEVGFAGRADRCYDRWQIPKICGYHLSASIISLGANTSLRSPVIGVLMNKIFITCRPYAKESTQFLANA